MMVVDIGFVSVKILARRAGVVGIIVTTSLRATIRGMVVVLLTGATIYEMKVHICV